WAANYAVDETEMPSSSDEDEDEDEYPPPATDDDRMSQCSNSSSNLGGIIRKRRRRPSGDQPLIARQWSESIENKLSSQTELDQLPNKDSTVKVIVNDTLEFVTAGVECIIEDRVTNRFTAAQLASWNFLTRNKSAYLTVSWRLNLLWLLGVIVRYVILFPIRLTLFCISMSLMFCATSVIGLIPNHKLRKFLNRTAMLMCFRIFARAFSSIIRYHERENMAKGGGISVANHTSPIDVMILSCDNVYAMIGQRQGGMLGMLQKTLSRAEHHIWFERSEAKDRKQVSKALQDHVNDPNKLPILIFPEGTCINNTSVMLFKKGSFEIASKIYPIALKYDNRLGDAFWNSHDIGYMGYLLSMMTSWALICDVWYLPPMIREEDESAIEFARRVKRQIAKKGGLIDLEWDGNLKRSAVPERMKEEQKSMFFNYLARTTSICACTTPSPEKLKKLMATKLPEAFDEEENEGDEHGHHHHQHDNSPSSNQTSSESSNISLDSEIEEKLGDQPTRQRRKIPLKNQPLKAKENL
uniref:Phospholipid/glycerol acyltransferase domain-containing protein n=1 Tax=Panagrolaimus sp. ES5 TaxID=591445 RepID=A0AC34FCD9_9BILA